MLETDFEKTHLWARPGGIGCWSDLIKQMAFDAFHCQKCYFDLQNMTKRE